MISQTTGPRKEKRDRLFDPLLQLSMAFGSSKWLVEVAPDREKHGEIHIPLSAFTEHDVSFTYPDRMISYWFGREKPVEY